jgi:hypothetical protein
VLEREFRTGQHEGTCAAHAVSGGIPEKSLLRRQASPRISVRPFLARDAESGPWHSMQLARHGLLREHMGRPKQFNREGVLDRAIRSFGNTASRTRQFSTWKRQPASTSWACIQSAETHATNSSGDTLPCRSNHSLALRVESRKELSVNALPTLGNLG